MPPNQADSHCLHQTTASTDHEIEMEMLNPPLDEHLIDEGDLDLDLLNMFDDMSNKNIDQTDGSLISDSLICLQTLKRKIKIPEKAHPSYKRAKWHLLQESRLQA